MPPKTPINAKIHGLIDRGDYTVEKADFRPVQSFRRDVVPVFTRKGCNAGGCHGSQAGKA